MSTEKDPSLDVDVTLVDDALKTVETSESIGELPESDHTRGQLLADAQIESGTAGGGGKNGDDVEMIEEVGPAAGGKQKKEDEDGDEKDNEGTGGDNDNENDEESGAPDGGKKEGSNEDRDKSGTSAVTAENGGVAVNEKKEVVDEDSKTMIKSEGSGTVDGDGKKKSGVDCEEGDDAVGKGKGKGPAKAETPESPASPVTSDCDEEQFDQVQTLQRMAASISNIERRNSNTNKRLGGAVTTGVYVLQGFIQIAKLHKITHKNSAAQQLADEIIESTEKRLDHLIMVDPAAKEAVEKSATYMHKTTIAQRQGAREEPSNVPKEMVDPKASSATEEEDDESVNASEKSEKLAKVEPKLKLRKVEKVIGGTVDTEGGKLMSRADIRASLSKGTEPGDQPPSGSRKRRHSSSESSDEWNALVAAGKKKHKVSGNVDAATVEDTKSKAAKSTKKKEKKPQPPDRVTPIVHATKSGVDITVDIKRPSQISFQTTDDNGRMVSLKSDESMLHFSFGNLRAVGIKQHVGTVVRLTNSDEAVDFMKPWVSKAVGLILQDPKLPIGQWADSVESGVKVVVIFVNSILQQLSDHPSKKTPLPRPIYFTAEIETEPEQPKKSHNAERPKYMLKKQPEAFREILKATLKATDLAKKDSDFIFAVLKGAMPELKAAVDGLKSTKKRRVSNKSKIEEEKE